MSKLWGGRFEGKTDAVVEHLGESVSFDARLAPWDIAASIAHADMLGACGVIAKADARKIVQGLKAIAKRVACNDIQWDAQLEDVHTNIESLLVETIGAAGKRLHTGRSRNDQIATDVRLWLRDQIDTILGQLGRLQLALLDAADPHTETVMPGFTHLQQAQPVVLAHHLHAYVEMFHRDRSRFAQLRKRANVMPLGSAALAGTPYPIDRHRIAKALGFDAISANSMDAVSDRDHLIEFCADAALVMMHLSRFCEELIIWSSSAYSFVEIGDAFTTGSSIMPQKKNPDAAELVRGKTGRVYGDLHALLTLLKGLPLTYNRDLQEDKEPVFDASDTVQLCLEVFIRMIPAIHFRTERLAQACTQGFMEATDLADYLVTRGVPFREAHGIVGQAVLHCARQGKSLPELSIEEFRRFSPHFDPHVYTFLTPQAIVKRRDNPGGTAPRRVRAALMAARKRLQKD
ncbi:MAG: argininosuccinate lyase [Candidatus Hydrogenedentes bacterium]|nr:argininosuccinate lyase [Candidatus Hydrogenedentota bacterium]